MKTLLVASTAAVLLSSAAMTAVAQTSTTAATGGTNVSADLAQNGAAPAFTTLGSIVISESHNNDFKTSGTLILAAPSGWRFNTAAAVSATPGKVGGGSTPIDISASVGAITASSITFNITVNAAARLDNLTLGGIQVQATEGGNLPVAGNVLRSSANPGTAVIVGISNDVTNFASLSQAIGALRLYVVLPGQSFTDGSTVASSGIGGAAASQAAGVSFNLVELVASDREFNVAATYSGAKVIAYSGPGGSPSYTTSVSFTGGHSTTSLATTLRKAETTALSATSATSPAIGTGLASSSFSVAPGPAAKLQILLPGETAAPGTGSGKTGTPSAQTAGVAILNNVRVNAVDADWNLISGAAAEVSISSSDAAAAIADDNGAAGGNLSLAGGSGILSSFTFWTGGAPQTLAASDFAAALGANTSASVTVNKAPAATSLSSSQNPSVFGQSVSFTATVSGSIGMPAGTVDFKDGSTVIGSAIPLNGSGVATFATSSLSVATHTITAVYSGNGLYNTSTSTNLSQVVSKAATATALASSLNPSCSGQPVTLTAAVSAVAPGSGIPTGSVNFKDGSTVIGSSIPLNGSGVATFTTSSLSVANHNLTAVYNGSGSFNTSTSSPVLVQVVKAKPTAVVSGTTSICPGGSANIQAALGGTSPWTVTWSDGVVQSGIIASPASRSVSPAATTLYSVSGVADAYCSNSGSGSATVTVNAPPAISGQPSDKSVCEGNAATFSVAASGTGLSYRWRKDGVNLSNGGHVSGATSATLTINLAAAADAGSYDVVVSGICPPALTSNPASLTVRPLPSATIAAASRLCAGSAGNSASVPDAGPGASYAWTLNNGTITGGAATSSITYTAGPSGTSMTLNVTVTGVNGCSTPASKVVALSTGDAVIEDWKNIPLSDASWQNATLQTKDMMYPEGGTVPYRLTLPQPCVGSTWSITLQYDFADNATGVHFCDFLTSYSAFEASVNGHACMGDTCTGETTFPIPADGGLAYQLPGVFTVENGTITSVSAYSTTISGGVTEKMITLTGTATPGADVMLLFGAHLARDYEWGNGKGAHEWPTGTASIGWLNYSGGSGNSTAGHTNVKVSDNILDNQSQSDLSVVATDSPDPVNAGHNLTFNIIVSNSGPLSSNSDTLTDAIPAGTTFVSATAPAGWTMTTPAAGGTGIVRWILPTGFNAGASATFGLVVAVDPGAVGTVENTATLTAGNVDAYQTNNSSHTSTTIFGACTMPVVGSNPASATLCAGANASFSASASGSPPPAIQWQVMASGGGSFVDLLGETGGSLSFAAAASQSGDQYRARFTNECGTVFSAAATLTVNTPPSVSVPANIVVDAEPGQCGANVDFVVSNSGAPAPVLTLSANPGSYFPAGITTVTATASNACGSASGSFTITVVEHQAPLLSLVGDAVMSLECHTAFSDPGATASDVCAGDLSAQIQVTGSVDANTPGSYTLSYKVTDPSGNVSSVSRTVNVVDTTAPVLSVPSALNIMTGPGATACGAAVSDSALGQASASDACAGPLSVVRDGVPDGHLFPVGTVVITYSATDPSGHQATATQSVTVVDNTPPVVVCPANIVCSPDSGQSTAQVAFAPTVSDNCPDVAYVCSPASGSAFPMGTTTVTVTATDASGHQTSSSFTVTVRLPNHAPVVSITSPSSGASFVVGVPVTFTGSFTDDAGDTHTAQWTIGGADVPGSVNDSTGAVQAIYTFTTPGFYKIKLTVTDQDSASGSASQVAGQVAQVFVSRPDATLAVDPAAPLQFGLAQNAPNPFRSATQIHFSLPVQSHVKLSVFDIAGREVVSLSNQVWEPGNHVVSWSGRTDGGAPARGGVYFVQMVAQSATDGQRYRSQKKMIRID